MYNDEDSDGNSINNGLIETPMPGSSRIKRNTNKNRDIRFDVPETNPADLINTLNDNDGSVAGIILKDRTKRKIHSFKLLSKNSAVAKAILKDIESDQNYLKINTLKGTNVLRFLSNIYDNQI